MRPGEHPVYRAGCEPEFRKQTMNNPSNIHDALHMMRISPGDGTLTRQLVEKKLREAIKNLSVQRHHVDRTIDCASEANRLRLAAKTVLGNLRKINKNPQAFFDGSYTSKETDTANEKSTPQKPESTKECSPQRSYERLLLGSEFIWKTLGNLIIAAHRLLLLLVATMSYAIQNPAWQTYRLYAAYCCAFLVLFAAANSIVDFRHESTCSSLGSDSSLETPYRFWNQRQRNGTQVSSNQLAGAKSSEISTDDDQQPDAVNQESAFSDSGLQNNRLKTVGERIAPIPATQSGYGMVRVHCVPTRPITLTAEDSTQPAYKGGTPMIEPVRVKAGLCKLSLETPSGEWATCKIPIQAGYVTQVCIKLESQSCSFFFEGISS